MSEILNELKHLESNSIQEGLAKTYFSTARPKENDAAYSRPELKNKKRRYLLYAILVGFAALFAVAFLAFNRIEVAIKVVPVLSGHLAQGNGAPEAIPLSRGGELNAQFIRNIVFYGNSGKESRLGKDFIILSNEAASGKASLGIDFAEHLNLDKRLFCFYSKGKAGREEIRISLKDDKNNVCYSKINVLKDSWQQFVINAEQAKDFVDLKHITHMGLEVNPSEKYNQGRETVYFKDIYLVKKEGE